MARRSTNEILGLAVQTLMVSANVDTETLSKATDLPVAELTAYLSGDAPFKLGDLAKVGGFLRIPVSELTEGIHA